MSDFVTSNKLRVLVLPPHDLWEAWSGRPPLDTEDRELPFRLMRARGIAYRRVDIHRWPWNPFAQAHPLFRSIDPLRALRILLFERQADVVLCYFESAALILVLLRHLLRFKGRIVVRDVGVAGGWRPRRWVLAIVARRADALLPLGDNQAEALRERYRPPGLVQAVPTAIDCDFFHWAPDQPSGGILAIGDDGSRDYATLMSVAGNISVPITIRTRLLRASEATPPNVRIVAEFLSPAAFRDMIGAAQIIVVPLHPSVHAGGISVLLQAMAMGKPVIISASPGILDYVLDERTCLVVPCHDGTALLGAIRRLMADGGLRTRLGNAARQASLERYSLPAQASLLEDVLRRLVNPPR